MQQMGDDFLKEEYSIIDILDMMIRHWWILLVTALIFGIVTFIYLKHMCKKLYPDYENEGFFSMYGMLTGTASTGVILLRELDKDFTSPACDNLVYQQLPAIVFGFPLMLLAKLAPSEPLLTFIILIGFFFVMNIILFRSFIFKKRKKKVLLPKATTILRAVNKP